MISKHASQEGRTAPKRNEMFVGDNDEEDADDEDEAAAYEAQFSPTNGWKLAELRKTARLLYYMHDSDDGEAFDDDDYDELDDENDHNPHLRAEAKDTDIGGGARLRLLRKVASDARSHLTQLASIR